MLRTKSKSRLWALALLCLVALTAVALGVMASRIPATAETTTPLSERETEWLKPYGFKQAEEADQIDGVVTWKLDCNGEYQGYQVINETDGSVMLNKGTNDPYTKNIEFDIKFKRICGAGFTVFADTKKGEGSDNYHKIGVRILADKVYSMSWWGQNTEHGYQDGKKLSQEEDGTINTVETVFHIVFGVRGGESDANEIYFKMTERDSGATWAEFTDTQPKGTAEWTGYNSRILIGTQFDGQNEYTLFVRDPKYASVDALAKDEDISYYWNRNNNTPIELAYAGNFEEKLISDIAVPANSAITWNMKCNSDDINMICFNMYNTYLANSYNFAVYKDKAVFTMRDGVNRLAGRYHGTGPAPYGDRIVEFKFEKSFTFSKDTNYTLKFSAQDVLDESKAVVGRLLNYGIKEASGEGEFVSAQAFTSWVSPKSDDKIGVALHAPSATNRTVTISSTGDAWYNIDYTDGINVSKQKAKGPEITLPTASGAEGKTFVGWASGNTFYQAGDAVTLMADTTFTATYAQFGIFEAAAVRVQKGTNGNETGLRFKGYVNLDDWNALKAIDPDVELVMGIERGDGKQVKITITEDQLYDVEGRTYKEFAVVVSITEADEAYYSTVYAAKTFVGVTYGDDAEVTYVWTNEMAKNSVQNIASVILENNNNAYDAFLASLNTEQRTLLEAFAAGADAE